MIELNLKPSDRELRWFAGLWFPAFLAIVGGLVWHYAAEAPGVGVWAAAAAAAIIGLIWPALARPIYVGWMCAAYPIGWTVSNLLLLGIYWLVVTPVGLAMRLVRGDRLARRFEPEAKTYWVERKAADDKGRYFRQY